MRNRFFPAVCLAMSMVALLSCKDSTNKTDKNAGSKEKTETAPASDNAGTSKKGMTVAEAKDFLDAAETNSGKEVTVTAYSWGSNERTDNKIQLNLGDMKLEGMQAATFSCMFSMDEAATIKAVAKDAQVTVTGKISKGAGGTELNDCKLVQ